MSGLYECLAQARTRAFYEANRSEASLLYTDFAIHSPRVVFLRNEDLGGLVETPRLA